MNKKLMIKLIEDNTILKNILLSKSLVDNYFILSTANSIYKLREDDFEIIEQINVQDRKLAIKELVSLDKFVTENAHRLANAYAMDDKPLEYNTAVFNIATKIHHVQCQQNHTDYCEWFYDKFDDEWNEEGKEYDGRNDYCIKADSFLQQISHIKECDYAESVEYASILLLSLHKETWNDRLQEAFSKIDEDYPCF